MTIKTLLDKEHATTSYWNRFANKMVDLLVGEIKDDHILQGQAYPTTTIEEELVICGVPTGIYEEVEVTDIEDEEEVAMAADAFDMGRIDQAALIDMYHWYWDRGLELDTIDREDMLAKTRENLVEQRRAHDSKGRWWRNSKYGKENKKRLDKMLANYKSSLKALDMSFMPYKADRVAKESQSQSKANLEYIELNISAMDLGTCAMVVEDSLPEMLNNDEITYKDFIVAKGILLRKLANACPKEFEVVSISSAGNMYTNFVDSEWHNDLQSTKELYIDFAHEERDSKSPSYDDRFFGEMSYDVESVIDIRRANPDTYVDGDLVPGLSLEDAIYCVQASYEEQEAFIPNMGL